MGGTAISRTIEITYFCQTRSSFGSDLLRSGLNGLFLFRRKEAVMEEKEKIIEIEIESDD